MDNNATNTAHYKKLYQSFRTLPQLIATLSAIFVGVCVLITYNRLNDHFLFIFGLIFCVIDFLLTKHLLEIALAPVVVLIDTVLNLDKIPKPDDAADALAVALTHAQTNTAIGNFGIR